MFEDMQFDGVDTRAITWGDEIAADVKAAAPVVVIGCGESGILAGIRLSQAGLPFTIVDKNDGPGGTWWENRYPGARVDVGQPPVLLLVRAGGPLERVLLPAARAPRLLRRGRRQVRAGAALPVRHHRVTASTWDEATARGTSAFATPTARPRTHRRPVRDQRRRFAEPAEAAGHPRHGDLRRAVVPLGALARRPRHHRHAVRADRRRRERLPDRADDRRRGRSS